MDTVVGALVAVASELNTQIAGLERELADRFDRHPDANVIRSLPGLGMILGTRVLAEFEPSPTASSASSTDTSATEPSTTNTPPGPTARKPPLDDLRPWDV
jgi:transposase